MIVSDLTHKLCILVLLITIFLIAPVTASVTLSGVKYMADVAPGATITFPMTLSLSPTDPAADYELSVLGFGNNEAGSYIGIDPAQDTSSYSARPFITLDRTEVHIDPGKPEVVTASIAVPQSGNGGLYALINIHPKPVAATGAGTTVVTAINVPIMITLTGTPIVETGTIESVTIGKVVPEKPVGVTTVFTSTGNHHYYGAKNEIAVEDSTGKEIARVATAPLVTAIVPGGKINFTQQITSSLSPGTYTVTSRVFNSNGTTLDTRNTTFTLTEAHAAPASISTSAQAPGNKTTTSAPLSFPVIMLALSVTVCIFFMRRRV